MHKAVLTNVSKAKGVTEIGITIMSSIIEDEVIMLSNLIIKSECKNLIFKTKIV